MTIMFHVATIANDLKMYHAMRASMEAAGFTDQRCRFTLFDNSKSNRFEPYGVLRELMASGDEPYVVLCHQDLIFNPENNADLLELRLSELQRHDRNWALAGNAGMDCHWVMRGWLDEPAKAHRDSALPAKVVSLDENFLVLRRSKSTPVSDGMSGFHLYGTDLCLNAYLRGDNAYVIEFRLRHLSSGNSTSPEFLQAMSDLVAAWRPRIFLGLFRTTCELVQIAHGRLWNRFLRSYRVRDLVKKWGICRIPRPGARRNARRSAEAQTRRD